MFNFILLTISFWINSAEVSTQNFSVSIPSITVTYPWEGKNIGSASNAYIMGNVKPYVSTITVNNLTVKVYKNGAFTAYVPILNEGFNIVAANEAGISTFTRRVVRTEDTSAQPQLFELISPSTYTEIVSGQDLVFLFRGLKSTTVYYEIDDICKGYIEDFPSGSGLYSFICYIDRKTKNKKYTLKLKYKNGEKKNEKIELDNFVSVIDRDYLLETSTDNVILKNDSGGYVYFLPEGVILSSDRKEGSKYRVKFGRSKFWVDLDKLNFKGFLNRNLITETGTLKFSKISSNRVLAKISIYNKVPFSVWEEEDKLYLNLYNTNLRTNWVVYDSSDTFIDNVTFRQVYDDEALFVFNFSKNSKFCGYDIYYSSDNYLNIEFKFKPFIASINLPDALKGINIIIDPGHSFKRTPPYDGAVGPLGSFEYEVNLKIATKLKDKLTLLGANVYMTRYTNNEEEQVPLQERPRIAKRLNGDIYVSIHNNAVPDGEDPYSKPRGFQIYYYHPHSKKLAESIHKRFVENIPLADEGVRYGDYHVARLTFMPSVLIENAYMIIPEQEELLNDDSFCEKLSEAITNGIIDYLK